MNALILQVKIVPKWLLKVWYYEYLHIFEIINIQIYFNVFLECQWICSFRSRCFLSSNNDKTRFLPDWTMTWWMSYKNQELLTLCHNLGSTPMCWVGRCCSSFFSFLCCIFMLCLSSFCVLCAQYCLFLRIVYSWFSPRFSLTLTINNE